MKPIKMSLGLYQKTILCFLLTLTLKGYELRTVGHFLPYYSHENTTAQRTYSQAKEHRNWALNSAIPEVRLLISMTRWTNAFPPLLQLEWVSWYLLLKGTWLILYLHRYKPYAWKSISSNMVTEKADEKALWMHSGKPSSATLAPLAPGAQTFCQLICQPV